MLADLDDRFDVVCLQKSPEWRRIVPVVGGDDAHPVEVSREQLPGDGRVVGSLGGGVNVPGRTRGSVDEDGGFHGFERVIRPVGVLAAGRDAFEAGSVNLLDLAEVVELGGLHEEPPPGRDIQPLFGVTERREVRQFGEREAEQSDDSRHL